MKSQNSIQGPKRLTRLNTIAPSKSFPKDWAAKSLKTAFQIYFIYSLKKRLFEVLVFLSPRDASLSFKSVGAKWVIPQLLENAITAIRNVKILCKMSFIKIQIRTLYKYFKPVSAFMFKKKNEYILQCLWRHRAPLDANSGISREIRAGGRCIPPVLSICI